MYIYCIYLFYLNYYYSYWCGYIYLILEYIDSFYIGIDYCCKVVYNLLEEKNIYYNKINDLLVFLFELVI